MIYKRLYSEIGKLLYAVADIDKVITRQEKETLRKIVSEELVPQEERVDSEDTNLAWYSEIEFDFLDEQIRDSESAFNSFIAFVEDHHSGFDKRMKDICLRVTREMAAAYRGTSKKEKELIKILKKKLDAIEVKE